MNKDKIEAEVKDLAKLHEITSKGNLGISYEPGLRDLSLEEKKKEALARLITPKESKAVCTALCYVNGELLVASNDKTPNDAKKNIELLANFINNPSKSTYKPLKDYVDEEIAIKAEDIITKPEFLEFQKLNKGFPEYNEFCDAISKFESTSEARQKLIEFCNKILKLKDVTGKVVAKKFVEDLIMPLIDLHTVTTAIEDGTLGKDFIDAIKNGKVYYIEDELGKHAEMKLLDELGKRLDESKLESSQYQLFISKLACGPCDLCLELSPTLQKFTDKKISFVYNGTHGGFYLGWKSPQVIAADQNKSTELINRVKTYAQSQQQIIDGGVSGYSKLREMNPYTGSRIPNRPILSYFENRKVMLDFYSQKSQLELELRPFNDAKKGLKVSKEKKKELKNELKQVVEQEKINIENTKGLSLKKLKMGGDQKIQQLNDNILLKQKIISENERKINEVKINPKVNRKRISDLQSDIQKAKSDIKKSEQDLKAFEEQIKNGTFDKIKSQQDDLSTDRTILASKKIGLELNISDITKQISSLEIQLKEIVKKDERLSDKNNELNLIKDLEKLSITSGSIIEGQLPITKDKTFGPTQSKQAPKEVLEQINDSKEEILNEPLKEELQDLDRKLNTDWYTAPQIAKVFNHKVVGKVQADIIDMDINSYIELREVLEANVTGKPNINLSIPLIVDAENSGFGNASHWVGLVVQTGNDGKVNSIKYFDPLGKEINNGIKDAITSYAKDTKIENITLDKALQYNDVETHYDQYKKPVLKSLTSDSNQNDCGVFLAQLFIAHAANPSKMGKDLVALSREKSINLGQKLRKTHKKIIESNKVSIIDHVVTDKEIKSSDEIIDDSKSIKSNNFQNKPSSYRPTNTPIVKASIQKGLDKNATSAHTRSHP